MNNKRYNQAWGLHGANGLHGLRCANYYFLFLISYFLFPALISCSSDDAEPAPEPQPQEWEMPISASASALPFEDGRETAEAPLAVTRSWTPPASYYLYDELYEPGTYFESLQDQAIDVFFTKNADATIHGRLRKKSDGFWKLALSVEPDLVTTGTYYVYGFIPRSAADNATLTLLPESSTYEDGAVLTIHGLKSITTDPCVIIGAKQGPNGNTDSGLRRGDFAFYIDAGTHEEDGKQVINSNYLYLLFDHLYSALCISMKVHSDYAALRTIKLKSLSLQTAAGATPTKAKTDVTITLTKTAGTNPITSVAYTPTEGEDAEANDYIMYSEDGITLSTSFSSYIGHFMPNGIDKLVLTSTYDVYDKNVTAEHPEGNLIRKNSTATNTLDVTELFSGQSSTLRGRIYNLSITIKPTYLYVLSEPDLDNPTMVVE